jgi:F0F1-type ATP synthase membrane subunit c/vacuolar-type H+-ATPase subunit K
MNTIQNNLKNRYSAILMGLAVLMSGLWGAIAQAAPLSAKMRAAAKQMQKQKQQQAKKQQKQAPKKVAPKVAPKKQQPPKRQQPAKKQQGKVLSDSEKALLAKAQWLAGLVKKDLPNKSLAIPKFECVDAKVVSGVGIACTDIYSGQMTKIIFGSTVKDLSIYLQTHVILHELAHAFDPVLKNRDPKASFDFYPHLKKYIAPFNGQQRKGMDSCEWHADWQAAQWMKKYAPERMQEIRECYGYNISAGIQHPNFPRYAPYEVMAQWLA